MKQLFKNRGKALMCILAGCLSCQFVHAADPVTMYIHHADGTKTAIQLYTRPQVTFEGDRVVITSPVATMSYAATDVLRFTYSGAVVPSAVSAPTSDDFYRQEGEQLLFDASVQPSTILLFAEDGKRMPVSLTSAKGHSILSLATLPTGVYVLSVNGRTSKVIKR